MAESVMQFGALGFWLFLAAVVVASIWSGIREKESQHETLRRIIESGKEVDDALLAKVAGTDGRLDQDLKVAGLIVIFIAPGIALLGFFISLLDSAWLLPLLGVAGLIGFVGIGLLVAARFAERSYQEEQAALKSDLAG